MQKLKLWYGQWLQLHLLVCQVICLVFWAAMAAQPSRRRNVDIRVFALDVIKQRLAV